MNEDDSQNNIENFPPAWKKSKLVEVTTIKGRIGWKGLAKSEFSNSGIIIINGPDIKDGKVLWDKCLRIPVWRHEESSDISVRKGDVLITKDGTIGKTAFIDNLPESASIASGIFLIRAKNEETLSNKFLYQYFNSDNFKGLVESVIEGSVIPHLYQRDLEQLTIPLPPLDEQKAIAKILSDLDSKIEHNKKMNQTLETIAQAIFKHWFIDFEFPNEDGKPYKSSGGQMVDSKLGEIPKGWNICNVYEIATVLFGYPLSSDLFNSKQEGLPIIRNRDLIEQSPETYSKEKIEEKYIIKYGDILVGMDGTFKLSIWKSYPAILNQRVCKFEPKQNIAKAFLYFSLSDWMKYFERSKVGTTVIHLGKSDIDSIRLIAPEKNVMAKFNEISEPIFRKITMNGLESINLKKILEIILPKLISGKIRVPLEEK